MFTEVYRFLRKNNVFAPLSGTSSEIWGVKLHILSILAALGAIVEPPGASLEVSWRLLAGSWAPRDASGSLQGARAAGEGAPEGGTPRELELELEFRVVG